MGKENLKGMSNLNIASVAEVDSPFGGKRVDIVDYSLLNFEEVINEVTRRNCVPGKKIYNNDAEVTKDPIKAIGDVSISYEHALGMLPSNIDNKGVNTDPVIQIIETAAKLETAKQNLNLTPKQKENFDGVQGNLKGVLGWISGMVASIKEPEIRRRAFTYFVLVPEVITMVGCVVKGIKNPEILPPNIPPTVEVATATAVPGVIEVNPTNPVTSPTETQVPIMIGGGYPTSESGFILNAGGSETEARDRIVALGAGDDLKALEDMYKEELLRTGKNPDNYTFEAMVWEGHGKVFWDSVVKDSSGKFMGFKLTEGPEKGLTVRAFGLTRYLLDYGPKDDFFEMFTLSNPPEFPDAIQQMVWDNSGWHVVGLFTNDGTYLGWFNADKGPVGEWQIKESLNTNLYRVVNGKIQESKNGNWTEVSVPQEIGSIKEVELHEGKMYGIDTADRAVVVLDEEGAWKKFERPLFGVDFSEYYVTNDPYFNKIEIIIKNADSIVINDISADEIVRMTDSNGTLLEWGYQKDSYSWSNLVSNEFDPPPSVKYDLYADYSGYFLGEAVSSSNYYKKDGTVVIGQEHNIYIFEIPHKYSRQIILIPIGDVKNKTYQVSYDSNYNTELQNKIYANPGDLRNILSSNMSELIGRQVVIRLQFASGFPNGQSDFWKSNLKGESYDLRWIIVLNSMVWLNLNTVP